MKKTICFILVFLIILLSGCEVKPPMPLDEVSVPTEDVSSLSSQIGIQMSVPQKARNVMCSIINDLIAECEFSYDGVIFAHRASKTYSGTQLYGVAGKTKEVESFENGDIEVDVFSFENGATVALWYENGNHHSLYSLKIVSAEVLKSIIKEL